MPQYLIVWNAGWGEDCAEVEAGSLQEANDMAYAEWKEAAESQADYYAKELTDELREDYGL